MVLVIFITAVENGVLTQKFQDILLSSKKQIISMTKIKCKLIKCLPSTIADLVEFQKYFRIRSFHAILFWLPKS